MGSAPFVLECIVTVVRLQEEVDQRRFGVGFRIEDYRTASEVVAHHVIGQTELAGPPHAVDFHGK